MSRSDRTNQQTSNPFPPKPLLWFARSLTLLAAGVAAYLVYVTVVGAGSPGACGQTNGLDCAHVLGSRWARWLGLPVSAMATLVYALNFLCLFSIGRHSSDRRRRLAWQALLVLCSLAGSAGLWFIWLQVFVLDKLCPYCMTIHTAGILVAIFVFYFAPVSWLRSPADRSALLPMRAIFGWTSILGGFVGTLAMIAGQLLVSHSGDMQVVETAAPGSELTTSTAPTNYQMKIFDGQVEVDFAKIPYFGTPHNARAVIVEGFDYTCASCRKMHQYLKQARTRYGDQLAIGLVAIPLNAGCNQYVQTTHRDHAKACEFSRLAIAVWRAKPEQFETIHSWLLEQTETPSYPAAREYAEKLVGSELLKRWLSDESLEARLEENVRIYHLAKTTRLPFLVMEKFLARGASESPQQLFDFFEKNLRLKPLQQ